MSGGNFDASEVVTGLQNATQRMRAAAERQLGVEAELILAEATKIVPIEEGMLQNSGRAVHNGLEAAVGFGSGPSAAYAVRQHEDLSLRHDSGRQAKYLEQPLMAAVNELTQHIGQAVRDAL